MTAVVAEQGLRVAALRTAATALIRCGHGSAVLRAAAATRVWAPLLVERMAAEIAARQPVWAQCGINAVAIRGHLAEYAAPAATAASATAAPAEIPPIPTPRAPAPAPAAVAEPSPTAGDGFPAYLFTDVPWTPPASTADSIEPPVRVEQLSAAAVLAQPAGEPLLFDGTLDGLRGVPVTDLAACHGVIGDRFAAAGMGSVYDIVTRVPLRYLDRTKLLTVEQARPGMHAAIVAKVAHTEVISPKKRRPGARSHARVTIGAGQHRIACMFFNQAWRAKVVSVGDAVLVEGEVTVFRTARGAELLQMQAPLMERYNPAEAAPLLPIYPQSEKAQITTWQIGKAAVEACRRISSVDDPLPEPVRAELALPNRLDALRAVHIPDQDVSAKKGRNRLAFDELLRLQLALGVRRNAQRALPGVTHRPTGRLAEALIASLPYPLTAAQHRAHSEITRDLSGPAPMNRLLQGDVGSGKTKLLELAALAVIESGHQAALMAPTGILAAQHYSELVRDLTPLGVVVGYLAGPGQQGARDRRETLDGLANGTVHLVVGTHTLITDKVGFASLGLVLMDEQHRFGVEQRAALVGKGPGGATPDVLVATATPIPRTAAISAFGDLDMSVLDEMPPGRTPIDTTAVPAADLTDPDDPTWQLIRGQAAEGRQAYVVVPLVEDSEKAQAAAADATYAALQAGALSGLRLGVATGKQPAAERTAVMNAFTAGEVDVLVATTVIEVGVNVPNATVIVILDADRFGLAQLHQLRGRVGRGEYPGRCVLVGQPTTEAGEARLLAMRTTTDGFVLAETDMQLRGPGALAGTAQAGHRAGLTVADLLRDADLMLTARGVAQRILAADPRLGRRPTLRHEVEGALGDDAGWLLHG